MLRFIAKIAAQNLLSTPLTRPLYVPLQRHVTRSVAVTPGRVRQKIDVGLLYVDRTKDLGLPNMLDLGPILEFGAGPHLTIPLLYARLGARAQVVLDVRRWARRDIVFAAVPEVNGVSLGGRSPRLLPEPADRSLDDYLKTLGIRYEAPIFLPLPVQSNSIGTFLCTQTLLHPPRSSVRAIFEEAARVLARGGIFVATTHLYDLYSDYDRSLSRFNFLRYSHTVWERWINSSLMSYNRLRGSDYSALLQGLPFDPILFQVTGPTDDDRRELSRIRIHPDFASYKLDDLASTHLFFILQKH
jgi:SAM-dependent methyltransferase